ncbi:hypothetical protein CHI12_07110 [Terribacillus saccharophilus]|uniref:Endonuclease GajA/Old nuclease/RecF-like AAA domain-containing protein n=1 Tax=Terribacillus saccharophilus TaxID=361277 RepID=A0A268HEF2_9BACI|nr:ATP-binding protein [Terribacillus saccharophilus]PAE08251.1 hypothetical protein CHI12_07110 [Terribacillus saccharophilus]
MLNSLNFKNWNQFDNVDITFNERITILTGVNGAGKSTIMRVIGKLLGWEYSEIARPLSAANIKLKSYTPDFLIGSAGRNDLLVNQLKEFIKKYEEQELKDKKEDDYYDEMFRIGTISSSLGEIQIKVPKEAIGAEYSLNLLKEEWDKDGDGVDYSYYLSDSSIGIDGINIPSHRMPYFYNTLNKIDAKIHSRRRFYNEYMYAVSSRQIPDRHYDNESNPLIILKSSLITSAFYANDSDFVKGANSNIFSEFTDLLRIMLPESLMFNSLIVDDGEVILKTETGDFLLDAVSSGIGSLIDLTWQIYMGKPEDNESSQFIVLIDEVENHLHPSMQRSILPKLLEAFPNAQFIITTHSPLVVNSIEYSTVYALQYNEEKKITSQELDFKSNFTNSMEVLQNVLGVPVTIPIWAEQRLGKIISTISKSEINNSTYNTLIEALRVNGLEGMMPSAIALLEKEIK